MKKLFFTLFIIVLTVKVFSQPVARQRVVIENFTATWCVNCPSAHKGIQDLIDNGYDVAPISYHVGGDDFQTAATLYRDAYYGGGSGVPDSWFDGGSEVLGGIPGGNMYSYYLPEVQARLAIPCDYTMSIYGHNSGLDYDVTIIIDLENGTPPDDLTLHFALCETHIPYSWQGETELKWLMREMYPDHFGTDIDFAGGDQVMINYIFTIDPTWDADNIEFTAFLQNEADKEILQGNWVPKPDLIPLAASANFSSSTIQPCEDTPVDFYDQSTGLIIDWEWTFEGGTPATSTAQNPTVTYSTAGTYDVTLFVDDGTETSTLLIENYIEVITSQVQAATPTGPTDICKGIEGNSFSTTGAPNAQSYIWSIDPPSAGTIMGTSNVATLDLDPDYMGSIDITVKSVNECGEGILSDAFQTTVQAVPSPFWMSDGSSYCEGTAGVEVTLDGSETSVDYELLLDGVSTGVVVAGTGSALSFGFKTVEGIYTIVGFTDYCDFIMYGTAYIYPIEIPGQAEMPIGDVSVCVGETTYYTTAGASSAEAYVWSINPPEAGTLTPNELMATIVWSSSFSGDATISVQGVSDCGDGLVSDPMTVSVNELPAPLISGEDYVYENTPGHVYSSPDHAQASYTWEVTGGEITEGQETYEITVTWGNMGTGYVNLNEMSAADCEGIATEFVVTIDEFVGIGESFMKEINLYPNPAGESLNIELYSEKNANITVQVVNQTGQIVIDKTRALTTGNNKSTLNTSELTNGYYTLKMIAEDGTVVQQKFVIMK